MGVACDAQSYGGNLPGVAAGLAGQKFGKGTEDVREMEGIYERQETEHQLPTSLDLRNDGLRTFYTIGFSEAQILYYLVS